MNEEKIDQNKMSEEYLPLSKRAKHVSDADLITVEANIPDLRAKQFHDMIYDKALRDQFFFRENPLELINLLEHLPDKYSLGIIFMPYLTNTVPFNLETTAITIEKAIELLEKTFESKATWEQTLSKAKIVEETYYKHATELDTLYSQVKDNLDKLSDLLDSLMSPANDVDDQVTMQQIKAAIAGHIDVNMRMFEYFTTPSAKYFTPSDTDERFNELASELTPGNTLQSLNQLIDWTHDDIRVVALARTTYSSCSEASDISETATASYEEEVVKLEESLQICMGLLSQLKATSMTLLTVLTRGWQLALDKGVVDVTEYQRVKTAFETSPFATAYTKICAYLEEEGICEV